MNKTTFYIHQIKDVYSGRPWYAEAVGTTLNKTPVDIMNEKPAGSVHSIAELMEHMIAWRTYVIEKLNGNEAYDLVDNSPEDWNPTVTVSTAEERDQLLQRFDASQKALLEAMEKVDDSLYEQQIPGRSFNFDYMVMGIIFHDVYHQGQINLLYRQLS